MNEDEDHEEEANDSWWIWPMVTLACLVSIGALSLARTRWAFETARQWIYGERDHDELIEEKRRMRDK